MTFSEAIQYGTVIIVLIVFLFTSYNLWKGH